MTRPIDSSNTISQVSVQESTIVQLLKEQQELKLKLTETSALLQRTQEDLKKRESMFTVGQNRQITSGRRVKWSAEDIADAISLRSISPRAYRYLRITKKMPLPAFSTLRRWAQKITVKRGLLHDVIRILKSKGASMAVVEKLCVLSYDEMYVSHEVKLDREVEQIVGNHKNVQVVMLRGLASPWKQPIYYDFDCPMTKTILMSIIKAVYMAGYEVVAIVSDMGPTNMGLWRECGISVEKTHITHPCVQEKKIFFFADAPHLLKLVQNHFFDSGFLLENQYVSKECLDEIITSSTQDLRVGHKITSAHLSCKGSQRQNVRLAAQVFSKNTAKAVQWYGENSLLRSDKWKVVADFLLLVNDWFDLLNSRTKFGKHSGVNAFGVELEKQKDFLVQVSSIFKKMQVHKHKSLLPFQKGVLVTNASLDSLLDYLKTTYNFSYIITTRLNQDILENFFLYIRGMGATHDHRSTCF